MKSIMTEETLDLQNPLAMPTVHTSSSTTDETLDLQNRLAMPELPTDPVLINDYVSKPIKDKEYRMAIVYETERTMDLSC